MTSDQFTTSTIGTRSGWASMVRFHIASRHDTGSPGSGAHHTTVCVSRIATQKTENSREPRDTAKSSADRVRASFMKIMNPLIMKNRCTANTPN